MNPAQLLAHFDRISDAPDAIPRLRRFILDLAVRGKLVEQDSRDEPASELLKRIIAEKIRRGRVGRVERAASAPLEDESFSLPMGWTWTPIADLVAVLNGRAYSQHELLNAGTPVLRVGNLFTSKHWYYSNLKLEDDKYCSDGDLIFAWSASFGPFLWHGPKVIYHYHIWKLDLHSTHDLDKHYLYRFLLHKTQEIKDSGHGISMIHMTKEKMEKLQVPLPPLAEQQRIVAKVDELMALCDRLEAAQAQRESRRDRLVVSSLNRLNDSVDAEAFHDHARFYFNHLPRLTTKPDHIQQLRQTILNLAVRGKLVPQDPNDEPVSVLLEQIREEQEELIKTRAIKPNIEDAQLLEEDLPLAVPPTWQWVPLRRIIVFGPQNGISPKPSSQPDAPRAITLTATTSGQFDPQHFKRVEATISPDSEFWLRSGDLLFQRGNTREYVGIAAYYTGEPRLFLYPDLMMKVRLSKKVSLRYVHLWSIAPPARGYFSTHATGAQATMPKINQGVLLQLPIPLPPLAEQQHIVAKVDELMALCDKLEAQLTTTHTDSRCLLEALLHEALAPAV